MWSEKHPKHLDISPAGFSSLAVAILALVVSASVFTAPSMAQSSSAPSTSQSQPNQGQNNQVPDEAGGPGGDSGPIAVPKKKDTEEALHPRSPSQPTFRNIRSTLMYPW